MRARILAAMLVVAAVGLTATGAIGWITNSQAVLDEVTTAQASAVERLRELAVPADGTAPAGVDAVLTAALQRIVPSPDESTFAVFGDGSAHVPATELPFRLDEDPAFIARIQSEASAERIVQGTAQVDGTRIRYQIVPVAVPGDPTAGLYVTGIDLDARLAPVVRSTWLAVAAAAATLLVLGLVGWLVAGRLLRPLRRMAEVATRASDSNLDERVPVSGNDDVSELAATVNGMLDRLEGAFEANRRLVDDVSHELRTPVTVVRGHLELVQADDPGDVVATRELAIDELDRMTSLIDDLTLLARADSPGFVQLEHVLVPKLTRAVLAKAGGLSAQHRWAGWPPTMAVVNGDPRRLTQAWLQLAQNAAKYAPAGSEIMIGSSESDHSVLLWVDDVGTGVPQHLRTRVFDRAERGHRAGDGLGSGLGLAIVGAIAEAHGGSARLEARAGGGTRAVIELPSTGLHGRLPIAAHPGR